MSFYKNLALYYDIIFPFSNQKKEFFSTYLQGNKKNILDAGCATGEFVAFANKFGHNVYGIDLSEELTMIAKNKGLQNIRTNDMLKSAVIFREIKFDMITCLGNTLVHLPDKQKISDFINTASQLLTPGGKLIIQIVNYDNFGDGDEYSFPEIKNEKFCFSRQYNFSDGLCKFSAELTDNANTQVYSDQNILIPVKSNELTEYLKNAGFKNIQLFGDFLKNDYTKNSGALIIIGEIQFPQ